MLASIMEEGLFSQMCQVPGFNEEFGHTYRDYLLTLIMRDTDIPQILKEQVKGLKDSKHILKLIEAYVPSS